MPLYTLSPEFQWKFSNLDGTRPANPWGVTVTPAQNAYGTYAEILTAANMAFDAYGIWIYANAGNVNGQARDMLLNIGVDPSGGSSYTELKIPDLLVSNAGEIYYYFPIFLPAGCSVGAAASINNATVGTVTIACRVFGRPKYPSLLKFGQKVDALGSVAASSRGTSLTMGTTSEGTRVALGSATTKPYWYWQLGVGFNNSASNARNGVFDLDYSSDGSTFVSIIEDQWATVTANEALSFNATIAGVRAYKEVASGATLYARAQAPGSVDPGWSAAAYGVCY